MTDLNSLRNQLDQVQSLFQRKFVVYPNNVMQNSYNALYAVPNSNGFLHYVEYSPKKMNPDKANAYFKRYQMQDFSCSGVFKNGKVFRSFDFPYNEGAQFIVKVNKDENRNVFHSSIGMTMTDLHLKRSDTQNVLNYGSYNEYFDLLPYMMVDGINDAGIYVQTNAIASPTGTDFNLSAQTECALQTMLARMILNRCDNVDEIESVLDQLHIYDTSYVNGFGVHLLVCSQARYYVIEFEKDGYELVMMPLISNFRMNRGFEVMNRSRRNFMPKWETIENCGKGVERFELMADWWKNGGGDFSVLKNALKFTNVYSQIDESEDHDAWLTDLGLSCDLSCCRDCHENKESSEYYCDFCSALSANQAKYMNRSRTSGEKTVHSVHTAVYDIANLSCELMIQEGNEGQAEFGFRL